MKRSSAKSFYLLCLLTLGLVGCGEDKNRTSGSTVSPGPAITNIGDIAGAADRRELVGRSVSIEDGTVQAVVGFFIFWGGDDHNQIPVVRLDKLAGNETRPVRAGDKVRIYGTVRLVESIPDGDRIWQTVNDNEKTEIKNATVYVAADRVLLK